ncbi:MAG TPA: nitrite reductase, partial [Spirochaetia bacterium]|nr:nitrite reductase [Spirochaetia bacterium]
MTFYDLPESLNTDIENYEKLVNNYLSGAIDKNRFKAFRVPMGIYEQRKNDTYMMRIRLPGGNITPRQLANIAEIAGKYTAAPLHITTRQDMQIHSVSAADTVSIYRELQKIGLSTRGGGGNTVRNITGSPDAGYDPDEVFDITPYIQALTSRLIAEPDSWTLPRKFKIAFSGSHRDTGLASVNDLGFIAKMKDGRRGFSVYAAGGMGIKPQIGIKLLDFAGEDQVYNITRAVKNIFDKYGNRKDRHHARLRFLYQDSGDALFREKFSTEYIEVKNKNYAPLLINEIPLQSKNFLEIPLLLGDISMTEAAELASILIPCGERILRTGQNQNIIIYNLPPEKLGQLEQTLQRKGFKTGCKKISDRITACAGASTCRLGLCLSRNLLLSARSSLEQFTDTSGYLDDISIKISGCPNACGQHLIGSIGFFGAAKRHDGKSVPMYHVMIGGNIAEDNSRFGTKIGSIPAKNVPALLSEILQKTADAKKPGENFSSFVSRLGLSVFCDLLKKYETIPDYKQDKSFYFDWLDNREFSISEKLEGECAAGLFDLIDYYIDESKKFIRESLSADTDKRNQLIKNAVASAANSLLITKGLEPKNDQEAVLLFRDHFTG